MWLGHKGGSTRDDPANLARCYRSCSPSATPARPKGRTNARDHPRQPSFRRCDCRRVSHLRASSSGPRVAGPELVGCSRDLTTLRRLLLGVRENAPHGISMSQALRPSSLRASARSLASLCFRRKRRFARAAEGWTAMKSVFLSFTIASARRCRTRFDAHSAKAPALQLARRIAGCPACGDLHGLVDVGRASAQVFSRRWRSAGRR